MKVRPNHDVVTAPTCGREPAFCHPSVKRVTNGRRRSHEIAVFKARWSTVASAMAITMAVLLSVPCPAAARQHVVIVVGASGTEEYGALFREWSDQWQQAAETGDAECSVIDPNKPGTSLQQLKALIPEAAATKTPEPLWIVLIGHGTFDGRTARFNLEGPDLSAATLNQLLDGSQRPVVIINSASCSSPFINALSGPGRIVISGTKDGGETQFTRFGGFLATAIGGLDADIDRDGQTSLLEAWLFAARRTHEYYESEGRLATEHSLLDDSGDGKGTRFEVFEGVRIKESVQNRDQLDGRVAHRRHLIRNPLERLLTPEQRQRRDQLEEQLEDLRRRRSDFPEEEYLAKLEQILVPLAKLYEEAEPPETKDNS